MFKVILFLFFTFLISDLPIATISSDYGIQIDMESPLSDLYEINYHSMGWSPELAAANVVSLNKWSDYVEFSFESESQELRMKLILNDKDVQNWNLENWNEYLKRLM